MSINGKFDRITRADARAVADRFGLLADLSDAIDKVHQAVSRWHEFAEVAGIEPDEVAMIRSQMDDRQKVFFA